MTSRTHTPEDVKKIMEPWRDSASDYERGFIDGMQKQMQSSVDKAVNAIKEALAQPEQEPVAWMFQHEETGRMMFVEAQQLECGFEKGNPRLKKIRPLYTTPPQRQHITDGSPCWCKPETNYTDPETGASVIVHREPQ